MSYPKWKYHREQAPALVQDEEAEKALGDEWAESPADFDANPQDEPATEAPRRGRPPKAKE